MDSSLDTRTVGLRDRQKLERERRIVKAAEKLFARKGYAEVAMEDVAARAGLAVGTIYNYFPSKSALLLAIVRRESESLLARGRKILDHPPRDPVAAACAFTGIFLDDLTRDDRRLWRELFGAAIADPSVVGRRLFEGDAQLVSQLASLLEHYGTCGVLASDLEPIPAATVLYGVCFTWMTAYLMNDAISAEMVRNEIRRGTMIAMRGLFPRTRRNLNYQRRCRTMIEIVEGFPDNVVGILAKGEVTRKDYLEVVIPAIEKALKRNAKVRLYYELGSEFTGIDLGAEWEDFKIGIEHLSRWERVAVVTDVAWIRHAVDAFRFLMPGEFRVFTTGQTSEARKWIVAA